MPPLPSAILARGDPMKTHVVSEMTEALIPLLAIPSVAEHGREGLPYGPGPARALSCVLELCERLGFRVKNADGRYGCAELGQGRELVGVLGHLDVVKAGDGWHYPPFGGTIDHGRLYGRGAVDDKGPMVAALFAAWDLAREYAARGEALPKRVRFLFGQTEEKGRWTDMEAYLAGEEPFSCGFTPDGDFPAIYCEKTILVVKLAAPLPGSGLLEAWGGTEYNIVPDRCAVRTAEGSLETVGRSAHGSVPWEGENAIDRCMAQLAEQGVPFAVAYRDLFGGDLYGEKIGIACRSPESGPLSLNVGTLRTEAEQVLLTLDIRCPETASWEEVVKTLTAAVNRYGFTVLPVHPQKGVYLDKESSVMQALLRAYRDATGDMREPLAIGGGTYARAMENIIAFGPHFPGTPCCEHQPDEYITLEDLWRLRQIYRGALRNLLELNR